MTKLMLRFKAYVAGLVQRSRDNREARRVIIKKWNDAAETVASELLAGAFGPGTPANISPWVSVNRYYKFSMLAVSSIEGMVTKAIKRGLEGATTVESFTLVVEDDPADISKLIMQLRLRRIKH